MPKNQAWSAHYRKRCSGRERSPGSKPCCSRVLTTRQRGQSHSFPMPAGLAGTCSLSRRDPVLWRVKVSQRARASQKGPALAVASSWRWKSCRVFLVIKLTSFHAGQMQPFGLIRGRLEPRREVTPKAICVLSNTC